MNIFCLEILFVIAESFHSNDPRSKGREAYDLRFRPESKEEVARLRLNARKPLKRVKNLEESDDDVYFPKGMDFPRLGKLC